MHAPARWMVDVEGGAGVGPVASPAEHTELGLVQTGTHIPPLRPEAVMVARGASQGSSSPGA